MEQEGAARRESTRLIGAGRDTSHQGHVCWDGVPWVAAAARGRFLLCLQSTWVTLTSAASRSSGTSVPSLTARGGWSQHNSSSCNWAWENPWIFAAPPDFEHTAQRGSACTLLTPLTTFHPPSYPSTVSHQAGKFSIVPTAVSLGTSVAFFGAVSTPETLFSFDPWLGICHFSVFPCLPGHEASLVPPASPEGTWSGRCQLR